MQFVVGIGANLGDRLGTMRSAVSLIAQFAGLRAVSRVYETAPIGPEQPDYLNAAVLIDFEGTAEQLLDRLLEAEQRLGRERKVKWGARTIDLDILWAPDLTIDTERLKVPHPRLKERAFALLPLRELLPAAVTTAIPPQPVRVTELALSPEGSPPSP